MSTEFEEIVDHLVQENAKLVAELSVASRDRASWDTQLQEAKLEAEHGASFESKANELNAAVIDLKKQLKIVADEREHYKNAAESGGGGSGGDHDLMETVRELQDQKYDLESDVSAMQTENAQLKNKVLELERKLAFADAAKQQQQQQQQHQDPQPGASDKEIEQLKMDVEDLQAQLREAQEQRDLFMRREERALASENRTANEMNHWSQLIKKLCSSLKNIRGQWDAEVEHNENGVRHVITSNLDADASHHIIEVLQRVSTGIKRGPSGAPIVAMTPGDNDNPFVREMRPSILDMLKLLHGVVSDSAVMWAQMVAAKHRNAEEAAEKEKAAAAKKASWF